LKLYYRDIAMKSAWFWPKKRHEDNETEYKTQIWIHVVTTTLFF
jgi:hypothetical protein